MLITQRRPGESILIGGNIEVKVVEITGQSVRLGIQAPREVEIVRLEVALTREQNIEAAQALNAGAIEALARKLGIGEPKSGK